MYLTKCINIRVRNIEVFSTFSDNMDLPTSISSDNAFHPYARPDGKEKELRKNGYQRHPKPPYSYVGMVVMAIENSPNKMLTLAEIHFELQKMFSFFSDSYRGWRDSVRHNLSYNSCFYKVIGENKKARGNMWAVKLDLVPANAFKIQDTAVARSGIWAMELHQQLGVAPVILPNPVLPVLQREIAEMSSVSMTPDVDNRPSIEDHDLSFGIESILKVPELCLPEGSHSSENEQLTKKTTGRRKSNVKTQKDAKVLSRHLGGNQQAALYNLGMLCQPLDITATTPHYVVTNPFDDTASAFGLSVNPHYGHYPAHHSMYHYGFPMNQYTPPPYCSTASHMLYSYPPHIQHSDVMYPYYSHHAPAYSMDLRTTQPSPDSIPQDYSTSALGSPVESSSGLTIKSENACDTPISDSRCQSYSYTFLDTPTDPRGSPTYQTNVFTPEHCAYPEPSSPLALPLQQ